MSLDYSVIVIRYSQGIFYQNWKIAPAPYNAVQKGVRNSRHAAFSRGVKYA